MAIIKSIVSGGNARQVLHSPFTANVPAIALVEHVFNRDVNAGDIVEMAALPAYCRILNVEAVGVGLGATTVNVGLMTGEPFQETEDERVIDTAIMATADVSTRAEATLEDLIDILGVGKNRSIGVTFSTAVPADVAKRLILRVTYAAT